MATIDTTDGVWVRDALSGAAAPSPPLSRAPSSRRRGRRRPTEQPKTKLQPRRDAHLFQEIVGVIDGVHHPQHVRRVDLDRARVLLEQVVRSERLVRSVEKQSA